MYVLYGAEIYSQIKWRVPLKITLMDWLFQCWTRWSFHECNNELIIGKMNPLVAPRIRHMGLMFKKKIKLINWLLKWLAVPEIRPYDPYEIQVNILPKLALTFMGTQEFIKVREWIPHIGLLPKEILLNLFLGVVPSSSENVTRAMHGSRSDFLETTRDRMAGTSFYSLWQWTDWLKMLASQTTTIISKLLNR